MTPGEDLKSYTPEMEEFFMKRTHRHIGLVEKYLNKFSKMFPSSEELKGIIKEHDLSKLKEPEKSPYIHITWDYHLKDLGETYKVSDIVKNQMNAASNYHVKNNKHHPEFWDPNKNSINTINREDRDKPGKTLVDATNMPNLYLIEMCSDWMAMSEEKGTDPYEWAKNNINKRWKFTPDQEKYIYSLLDSSWK